MSRDGLLRAIADAPEDDTVRLVFADWLEEHGDEVDRSHAELIRVQIEVARLALDDDRRAELEASEEERLRHRGDIHRRLKVQPCVGWAMTRGFPDRVGYDWNNPRKGRLVEDDLAQMAESLHRLPIRTFAGDLLGCAPSSSPRGLPPVGGSGLELLAGWSGLSRLDALEATSGITPYEDRGEFAPGLLALAASPHARGLRRLRLGGWQVDPDALAAVASVAGLPRLTELDFSGDHSAELVEAVGGLVGTPLAHRLEKLLCDWVELPGDIIRGLLVRAPLRAIAFGVPEDEADGVGPLLGSPGLALLRELRITGEEHGFFVDELPGDRDHRNIPHLIELLASADLAGLESLHLRGVALGDGGVKALINGAAAASLVELDLSLCGLTGDGLRTLRPLLTSGRLRRLSLGHNLLTRADAEDMASWPEFGRLHRLDVGFFNHLGEEGRAALKGSPHRHQWLQVT
jgi:uncharacterized protein (TIGR02996 family)